jgi:hypothetical protein
VVQVPAFSADGWDQPRTWVRSGVRRTSVVIDTRLVARDMVIHWHVRPARGVVAILLTLKGVAKAVNAGSRRAAWAIGPPRPGTAPV